MKALRLALSGIGSTAALALSVPIVVTSLPFWVLGWLTRAGGQLLRRARPAAVPWQDLMRFEPGVGWMPRARLSAYAQGDRVFQLTTDDDGWRGKASLETADVVVIGDSFAFGHGTDDATFFADLPDTPRIKAIGANGYSMVHGLLWMDRLASQLAGKMVIWFVYYGNDLYENLTPNLDRYRMPFVRQEGRDWQVVTEHVSPEPWRFGRKRNYHGRLAELCTPGHLSARVFSACEFLVQGAQETCSAAGASLLVVGIPDISQMDEGGKPLGLRSPDPASFDVELPRRRLTEICAAAAVAFIDLSDHLNRSDYKQTDCHWKPSGHRKVADLVTQLYDRHQADTPACAPPYRRTGTQA